MYEFTKRKGNVPLKFNENAFGDKQKRIKFTT